MEKKFEKPTAVVYYIDINLDIITASGDPDKILDLDADSWYGN